MPSDKECAEFAKRLEASMNEGNPALFDRSFDVDAIMTVATRGLALPDTIRASFRRGIRRKLSKRSVGSSICEGFQEHSGSYKLLKIHTVNGTVLHARCSGLLTTTV
ncbi:MAG: hypothetical protein ACYTFI_13450 [Planctomycetota bacterium]